MYRKHVFALGKTRNSFARDFFFPKQCYKLVWLLSRYTHYRIIQYIEAGKKRSGNIYDSQPPVNLSKAIANMNVLLINLYLKEMLFVRKNSIDVTSKLPSSRICCVNTASVLKYALTNRRADDSGIVNFFLWNSMSGKMICVKQRVSLCCFV